MAVFFLSFYHDWKLACFILFAVNTTHSTTHSIMPVAMIAEQFLDGHTSSTETEPG